MAFEVADPKVVAEGIEQDPLRRVEQEISDVLSRLAAGLDWPIIQKGGQELEDALLMHEISDSHDARGTAFERFHDFARELGFEILDLSIERALPESSVAVGKTQIEVENKIKIRNLEQNLDVQKEIHQNELRMIQRNREFLERIVDGVETGFANVANNIDSIARLNQVLDELRRQLADLSLSAPATSVRASPYLVEGEKVEIDDLALKAAEKDKVFFSLYFPQEVLTRHKYGIYLYAHLPSVLAMVQKDVKDFEDMLGGRILEPRSALQPSGLRRGTPLTVEPICPGLDFEPLVETKPWSGDFCRFDFEFEPANDLAGRRLEGRISVLIYDIEIAHIDFSLDIRSSETANILAEAKLRHETRRLYQRIFVSYSRRDRVVVDRYRLAQEALGNDVFVDTYSIRAGDDWKAALARAIDESDILQLFWSESSSCSSNVREEWDYALSHRCPEDRCARFIRPVFWVQPIPVAPPTELAHLNFRYVPLNSALEESREHSLTPSFGWTQDTTARLQRLELKLDGLVAAFDGLREMLKNGQS
jgi:hypothetical protein